MFIIRNVKYRIRSVDFVTFINDVCYICIHIDKSVLFIYSIFLFLIYIIDRPVIISCILCLYQFCRSIRQYKGDFWFCQSSCICRRSFYTCPCLPYQICSPYRSIPTWRFCQLCGSVIFDLLSNHGVICFFQYRFSGFILVFFTVIGVIVCNNIVRPCIIVRISGIVDIQPSIQRLSCPRLWIRHIDFSCFFYRDRFHTLWDHGDQKHYCTKQ